MTLPAAPVFFDPSQKALGYQDNMDFTQSLRKQLIHAQLDSCGGALPTDKDGVELLLKIAKDMDHTSHSDKKNRIEEANSENGREVADAMKLYVGELQNRNPFMRNVDGSAADDGSVRDAEFTVADAPGVLPSVDPLRLGDHAFVNGEEEVGVIMETAAEFMARMTPIVEAQRAAEDNE